MSIEAELAIGRPARSTKEVTCSRCKGTGWWQFARRCFKCGGKGYAARVTRETRIRDKRAHLVEVLELHRRASAFEPRFGKHQHAERVTKLAAQIVTLSAELAALEASP